MDRINPTMLRGTGAYCTAFDPKIEKNIHCRNVRRKTGF